MIKLKNVSKSYQMGEVTVHALDNVSLTIEKGEFIVIAGASGSGKSTLLHILGGLDRPNNGEVVWNGQDIRKISERKLAQFRNNTIGFVFQQFHLLPKTSVLENTLLPTMYNGRKVNRSLEKAKDILKKLGLDDRIDHTPAQLSGGQQQRVAIARSLINSPKAILADEPTGNLDSKSGEQILKILERLNREENITLIVVTHDQQIAKKAKRIIKMKDGRIIEDRKKTK